MNWPDRIEQFLLVALSGFVFWPNAISSIALISLVIVRLIRQWRSLPGSRELLLLVPAFIMVLSWMLHGFASDGVREIQLWPTWLAAVVYFKTSPFRRFFLQSFTLLSVLQSAVLLFFLAFSDPFAGQGFSHHVREAIEQTFHVHPTFLSAAWCWAALLLLFEIKRAATLRIAGAALLVIMAAVCAGKMPLLAMAIATAVAIAVNSRWANYKKWIGIGGVVVALGLLLATPTVRERLDELTTLTVNYQEGDLLNSSQLRLGVWSCATKVTHDHWLNGVGPGNTRSTLEACYEHYNQVEFFEGEYNTHNQFLHFWLCAGILGFAAFIMYCIWLMIHAVRTERWTLLTFLVFFFLIALTENYFSRQFGMMLWSFSVGTLLFESPRNTPTRSAPGSDSM